MCVHHVINHLHTHTHTHTHNMQALLFLVERYQDMDVHDGDGWTPLMYAAKCKAASVVKYLLQRGASANVCHVS